MSRILISLAVATALLAAGNAEAQKKPPTNKKLYRWVDRDGKVQFSDTLPAEAIDQARTEMSNSGRITADVGRALSAEERAAFEAEAAEAARREAEAEQVRQSEEAMISSFQTEEDLRRSVQVRVELLKQTLDAIEAGIASQRASLTALLAQASEAELGGGAVKPKQAATILELHEEIGKQQQMLIVKKGELDDVDKELEYLLRRFREIKTGTAATDAAAEAPADAPANPPSDAPAETAAEASAPTG